VPIYFTHKILESYLIAPFYRFTQGITQFGNPLGLGDEPVKLFFEIGHYLVIGLTAGDQGVLAKRQLPAGRLHPSPMVQPTEFVILIIITSNHCIDKFFVEALEVIRIDA
jgi:hypothetical protein